MLNNGKDSVVVGGHTEGRWILLCTDQISQAFYYIHPMWNASHLNIRTCLWCGVTWKISWASWHMFAKQRKWRVVRFSDNEWRHQSSWILLWTDLEVVQEFYCTHPRCLNAWLFWHWRPCPCQWVHLAMIVQGGTVIIIRWGWGAVLSLNIVAIVDDGGCWLPWAINISIRGGLWTHCCCWTIVGGGSHCWMIVGMGYWLSNCLMVWE